MELDKKLGDLIGREIEALGYELVKIEPFLSGRRKTVRIFIDRPDEPVKIADCVRVTKALGLVLDGVETLPGPFNLEVSSPGSNRPLTKSAHFACFRGARARVEYLDAAGVKTTAIGSIVDADEGAVTVSVDGTPCVIALERILKANLHPVDARAAQPESRARERRGKRGGKSF